MTTRSRTSDRTRFILQKGVVRFGIPIGLAAAWVAFRSGAATQGDLVSPAVTPEWFRTYALPLLAFVEWGLGGGWLLGAVAWFLGQRRPSKPPTARHRSPRERRR